MKIRRDLVELLSLGKKREAIELILFSAENELAEKKLPPINKENLNQSIKGILEPKSRRDTLKSFGYDLREVINRQGATQTADEIKGALEEIAPGEVETIVLEEKVKEGKIAPGGEEIAQEIDEVIQEIDTPKSTTNKVVIGLAVLGGLYFLTRK